MLNVGKIENGIVLDHIHAGRGMSIYHHLQLNKLECPVAIIKNARSNIMGKKDILKIETDAESINLDVIPFIDPDVTVNIIRNGELVMKKRIQLPKEIRNVIRCNNPRCITTIEQGIQHIFYLADTRSN
ncbi:MAG: aspartate carbamoyltransferase regulatory subunit, partial [Eubacteriales bacterium]|nr:aspartate carbamoyltransferase regulatory subunit [Eubacteriales bacterium]